MDLPALYRDIVETSPDGIWVFDVKGRTLYANAEIIRMLGIEESQVHTLTVFDSVDEAGRAQLEAHLRDVEAGRLNDNEVECQFVRRDGSTFWVLVRESGLYGPGGELTGILHRISDYTQRRQVVDALRESQQKLSEAQRTARIGSWDWDVQRDEITVSEELCALYGLDPSSFPAGYDDFLGIVHPTDRPIVDAAVRSGLDGADEFLFVARIQAEDDWVWTRGRGVTRRDATGRVVTMSGTHQDITAAKNAEEALEDQFAQNALMQAVAIAANEARTLAEVGSQAQLLVLLHDDWERARGFVPAADGGSVVPLYLSDEDRQADAESPDFTAAETALANRAFRERASVWDDRRLTVASPVNDGVDVCAVVAITSAPPLHRHDMITSMIEQICVQFGRVAERERAERELASARDAAMEGSRQKSEFLATMSHEIRTPLNGVIGLNDLLLRTSLDPDQRRLSSGVQLAGRALLSVINDILDFSKIEAGKLELERLDFETRLVFDQVASVLSESARAKGIALMVSCHPDVPEVLAGDPTRLAQVLTNLGSNAVKFTDSGEVHVRATATPTPEGRTLLRVEVTDTGVGVDDEAIEHLFEPFTQADASTTRVYGGTGLGLAICREIVEALGGEIGVEANPGGGSHFWFTALFDASTGTAADPEDAYARTRLGGQRVLVVDDNEHNRLIVEEQLARWLVRTQSVASADEAMAALHQAARDGDQFEAALLDLAMPHRDGLDLAREIRRHSAYDPLPLLVLSSTDASLVENTAELGIVEVLTKPVLSSVLRTTLLRRLAGVAPGPVEVRPLGRPSAERPVVLVVEDNAVNQMVAVGLLEALGYSAVTADDGVVAIDLLVGHTFDAILMDVQMPRMDGYAATRSIRDHEGPGERVPVIAMTAAAVEGERERCLAAGMDDFLTKPVDPQALVNVLNRWLKKEPPMSTPPNDTDDPNGADDGSEPSVVADLDVSRIDELRDLDPGNTTYLDRAIGNFVTNTPITITTIRAALEAGDAEQLKAVSHKLAGGALNLGVERAGRVAQQIELVADTGATTGAADLVEQLDVALERGRAALLAYQAAYHGEAAG